MIFYFLHIPKCAGTSFTNIIDNYFENDSILQAQTWNQLLPNMPKDFSKFNLIRGHFGYSLNTLIPDNLVYVTMLRNPIERTISQYHHIRIDPETNNWVNKEFLKPSDALTDIINNPFKRQVFSNTQTRYLALDIDVLSTAKNDDNFLYDSSKKFTLPTISDDCLIDTAKRHLSEFAFFGLQEQFEESLMLLYYTFAWKPIQEIPKSMVWPGRPCTKDLSEDLINSIMECTKLDSELYNYAQQIFNKRFSEMITDLKERFYEPQFHKMTFKQTIYKMLEKHCKHHNSNQKHTPSRGKNLLRNTPNMIKI